VGSIIPCRAVPRQKPTSAKLRPHIIGRSFAAQVMRTRRRGDGVVYVTPGCFDHPKTRAFWPGGASGACQLSEGRRAQGQ